MEGQQEELATEALELEAQGKMLEDKYVEPYLRSLKHKGAAKEELNAMLRPPVNLSLNFRDGPIWPPQRTRLTKTYPEQFPPFLWTGHNMNSVDLASYMFDGHFTGWPLSTSATPTPNQNKPGESTEPPAAGIECSDSETPPKPAVGPANKDKETPKKKKVKDPQLKALADQLIKVFEASTGLRLMYLQSEWRRELPKVDDCSNNTTFRPRAIVQTQSRVRADHAPNSALVLICAKCFENKKDKRFIPVIRCRCHVVETTKYLQVLDVYFHHCGPEKEPTNPCSDLLTFAGSTDYLDHLREKAFGPWIKALHALSPEQLMGQPGKDMSPALERILLGTKKQVDIRFEIPMTTAQNIPKSIEIKNLVTYMSWIIYRVANSCPGFADEYPDPDCGNVNKRQAFKEGDYPMVQSQLPRHLSVTWSYLVFGGTSITEDGEYNYDPDKVDHQQEHSDFRNHVFGVTNSNPLLVGLQHPFTFNTALDTERSIWVDDDKEPTIFKQNETLVVGCDTLHRGNTYIWDGKYYPSIHSVMHSTRHLKDRTDVVLSVDPSRYIPATYLLKLNNREFADKLAHQHRQTLQYFEDFQHTPRRSTLSAGIQNYIRVVGEAMRNCADSLLDRTPVPYREGAPLDDDEVILSENGKDNSASPAASVILPEDSKDNSALRTNAGSSDSDDGSEESNDAEWNAKDSEGVNGVWGKNSPNMKKRKKA